MKPLITLIVAVYNGEKYLDDCLKSLVKQTYANIEIIVIDDGSTDDSGGICDRWAKKDKRVIVKHQKNCGVSKTRNIALDMANGEYVCLVDQDDFVDRNYVKYLYSLLSGYSAEVSTIPNVVFHTKEKDVYLDKDKTGMKELWSGVDTACSMLYGKMEIGPWNKMISMRLLKDNKIRFYDELFGGEGYVFSVECFSRAKKVAIGYDGVYYYRVDNNTSEMSSYRSRTFHSSLRAIQIMKNEFKKNKFISRAIKYAYWRVHVAYLHAMIASGAKDENIDDYKMMKRNCRRYAYRNIFAPVPLKRKVKELLYMLSPMLVVRFDLRKQTVREFSKRKQDGAK